MPSSPFAPLSFKALVYNNIRKHKKCSSRKASSRQGRTMEDLPAEVLSEIFVRLLAKQLAQMRCISKSWNALLSDSSFIKFHLHRSNHNNDGILLFFGRMISFELSPTPFTARASRSPDLELPNFLKLPVIRQSEFGDGSVIGSVDGLICFFYKLASFGHKGVYIWTPSLSALLTLPPSPLAPGQIQFGFGFDPNSDDYKVIRLTTLGDSPNMETQCEVYSMKKGSWESISQRFPSHITIIEDRDQVCVNGHLHWLGYTEIEGIGMPVRIVAFDVGAEVFIEVPLPESILDCNWYKYLIKLAVLGGKLCVMSRLGDGEWEVWVMEEYGVAESWVKHQVSPPFNGDIIPYGFTSQGEFVFQVERAGDRFGLYDPIEAKTKTFKIMWRYRSISRFVEYADSLVWIQHPNRDISTSCDIS